MKLLSKKIKSHRCLEFSSLLTTPTEENMMSCSRAFRKPKNFENERNEINRKQFPKVNKCSEKVVFEKMFLEWPNGKYTKIQYSSLTYSKLSSLGCQYYRRVTELLAD